MLCVRFSEWKLGLRTLRPPWLKARSCVGSGEQPPLGVKGKLFPPGFEPGTFRV